MNRGLKYMKVFISWSGDTSLKVAQQLREWLPYVINSINPYVSSEDIDKGARWSTDIAKELEDSTFGILCVTKDNLEAPWLSFEAGALSKTMEKSFVTPFLFDIKRSEIKGPILQFQSTIFEKDDIKKLVKTLNKACGESGIPDDRLEKTFNVWYPNLEENLNALKNSSKQNSGIDQANESVHSTEILEEILELSRDNQRLLRNPDEKMYEDLETVKKSLEDISRNNAIVSEQKRASRKYSSIVFEEIMHMNERNGTYGFLMTLSLFKADLPWIYDMGKELIDMLKGQYSIEEKKFAIKNFREMIDFTFSHPIMHELYFRNKSTMYIMKDLPFILSRYIDDIYEQYVEA